MRKREDINELKYLTVKKLKGVLQHINKCANSEQIKERSEINWVMNDETMNLIIKNVVDVEESGDIITLVRSCKK